MFTYERGGISNSKLIAGDIYMKYKDTNREINLSNAMPSATYEGGDYFEFEITGKNTSNKTIYYELLLNHGGLPTSGTYTEANRIADEFLRFRLVEVTGTEEGNDLLTTTQYYNIDNERIYVGTIPGGGASAQETTTKYRLYCWIDNSLGIGVDYTQEEWNNLFASIGVNVNGDFTVKTLPSRTLITYNANGGKVLPSKKEIKNGQTTYEELATPTKDGYVFDGWYSDSELTTKVESTTTISGTLPTTLYAKWSQPFRGNATQLAAQAAIYGLETTPYGKIYTGANPSNYVLFNNEQWRILGVYENELKIIRSGPVTDGQVYNSSTSSNAWAGSTIQADYLYTTYWPTLSSVHNMIDQNASWDVGVVSANPTASSAYTSATTTNTYNAITYTTPWEGKIGLIAVYEYLYATENNENWLSNTLTSNYTTAGWTLTPFSGSVVPSFCLLRGSQEYGTSKVGNMNPLSVDSGMNVTPVVYLKSDVTISGGNGKYGSEYTLSCTSCSS